MLRFILTNVAEHAAIHGKARHVTSFSGIPHAFLQGGVEKIEHCGFRVNGNDAWT